MPALQASASVSSNRPRLNEEVLRRVARFESRRVLWLLAPAAVLLAALLIIPVGWLFYLSFVDGAHYSLVHYQRLIQYTSYSAILLVTIKISLIVTAVCVAVGYPTAYLLAQLPRKLAVFCLALVLIPFWTSLLVRTYAWLVLLGASGPISPALRALGVISDPLALLYNQFATTVGMVHIMLPFFILPLYASLRSFDWNLIQAAASLGAPPVSRFSRVFLPLSLPGIWAGAVLVFVQSLGFYVTPALLGGGKVTMVSMKMASNVQEYFEWGAASAFGMVLLITAGGVLVVAGRFLGFERATGTTP